MERKQIKLSRWSECTSNVYERVRNRDGTMKELAQNSGSAVPVFKQEKIQVAKKKVHCVKQPQKQPWEWSSGFQTTP